ncbi:MAG: hypothetical protein ISS48_04025 [Candidatus Aenigmarchaeota archaeon]|nr:hypothetical protein [Candidatus Aenigmarchaeota archaeon]
MKQKEIKLGWQDIDKLKNDGRILEAFLILVNWFERNLQLPIYYYYILSKKDESKKKKFLERFEKKEGKETRLSREDLAYILNDLDQSRQEKVKVWVTITKFWTSNEVWEDFKSMLRSITEEHQLKNTNKLIQEISDFREMRGRVFHRLVEDRVTYEEVEKYYEFGNKLNRNVQQLHYKFLHRKTMLISS